MTLLMLAFLLFCAIAVIALLCFQLQKKDSRLRQKQFDARLLYKDCENLSKAQSAIEKELAAIQGQKALAATNIEAIDTELRQAQENSGLQSPLSPEDFIDWLRKLENAAKAQGEAQLCAAKQAPCLSKAEDLRQILQQCRLSLRFLNSDNEDFYALVSAAEKKVETITSLKKEISRKEQEQQNILAEQQQIKQKLEQNQQQTQQAETAWQTLLQEYFNGRINAAVIAENLPLLSDLIPLKAAAEQKEQAIKRRHNELDELHRALPDIAPEKNAVEAAFARQQEELSVLDEHYRQAMADKAKAENALQRISGGDTVAQLEQQKQLLLLEMQEQAEEYWRRELGWQLAQAAKTAWRKAHRGPMLQAAERAFAALTGGTYPALQTQQNGNTEILQAIASNNTSKAVTEMSKGTRFQLYMALRAAAYEDLLSKSINMPFFCDDIFESFDEERTRAACRLMQHIGQKGQAIYLTHHRHVANIAQEICGDNVTLHNIN
ncbi:ATP-binding protein [Candidatus Tokpelaia sp.]|uniref:ATP-binding protein n=1 Tax=Candidatus Tokpelaia sp. TaxID=2233777 RepID=UPI00123C1F03|nr:hypothetical protein [Candidatus Tokpelaia sp.]KAA6404787.1 hypothetical protein DPQ22_07640 [Candidatus Tokpelaia sp.]